MRQGILTEIWHVKIRNEKVWKLSGQKPMEGEIGMRRWRWIGLWRRDQVLYARLSGREVTGSSPAVCRSTFHSLTHSVPRPVGSSGGSEGRRISFLSPCISV
ncbi:hypothetical protein ElyMa_006390500 [Elysia marginata]|uniref:PH domain-containing protein n=1 Tax=Elysia marginata TaxID=1093978 RepID=A0AAV4HPP5_9GAST|nr:hypothetical protein ElyMa_006390500 [Elysia marginata]